MKSAFSFLRICLATLCLAATIGLTGCQTNNEPENMSQRPWGYRSGYDPGLPSMLNEGR